MLNILVVMASLDGFMSCPHTPPPLPLNSVMPRVLFMLTVYKILVVGQNSLKKIRMVPVIVYASILDSYI